MKNIQSTFIVLFISVLTFAQVGINTQEPTKTLDVNGTTRVRTLPENGTSDFVATKTVVTNADGVLGVVEGLPVTAGYDNYYLRNMQGFEAAKATKRTFSYGQIVGVQQSGLNYTPLPSVVFNPIYTLYFDKYGTNPNSFIQMKIDYIIRLNSFGTRPVVNSFQSTNILEIRLNDNVIKTYPVQYGEFAGGGSQFTDDKYFTADISSIPTNATNNKLEIVIKNISNQFINNQGTAYGQFSPTANPFMELSVSDLSFQFYQK